jgi:hypothetical protein
MTEAMWTDIAPKRGSRLEYYKVMALTGATLTIGYPNDGTGGSNLASAMAEYRAGALKFERVPYMSSYTAPAVGDTVAVRVSSRMGMFILGKVA